MLRVISENFSPRVDVLLTRLKAEYEKITSDKKLSLGHEYAYVRFPTFYIFERLKDRNYKIWVIKICRLSHYW